MTRTAALEQQDSQQPHETRGQAQSSLGSFVWSIAEILRGDFKQSEYGKVILPFVVMRRLDCILEGSKKAVLEAAKSLPKGVDDATKDMILFGAAGSKLKVYNLSAFTFSTLKGQDAGQLHANLLDYVTKFSGNVRDIFLDKFLFTDQLKRLKDGGILWQVFERLAQVDLHPDRVTNIQMGYLFEDLIRRFSEISNETAGEHFTPREVIRLIVDLLLANDEAALTGTPTKFLSSRRNIKPASTNPSSAPCTLTASWRAFKPCRPSHGSTERSPPRNGPLSSTSRTP